MSGTSKTILLTNNDIASSDIAFSSFSGLLALSAKYLHNMVERQGKLYL